MSLSVWAEVYKDFGMTEDQALGYFSGPAFQAWQRMGNIHGSWGKNTTREWVGELLESQGKVGVDLGQISSGIFRRDSYRGCLLSG